MYRALEPALKPLDVALDSLTLDARGSWTLVLDNDALLELGGGTTEDMLQRAALCAHAASDHLSIQALGCALESADLRYEDGYALRLKGVTTGTSAPATAAPDDEAGAGTHASAQRQDRTTGAEADMAREYKDVIVGWTSARPRSWRWWPRSCPAASSSWRAWAWPQQRLKRGVVVNIDATVQSIQQALKEAELMADCKIQRVYTGITGSHIRGLNSSGMVAIKDKEVTTDVARVIETAKAINISSDQRLLLVEPQEFVIDGQEVREPIGMSGIRLEAKVHIVTGAQSAAENIIKCVRRCGLEVEQLLLNPLASARPC
jgi:hypothetical protein